MRFDKGLIAAFFLLGACAGGPAPPPSAPPSPSASAPERYDDGGYFTTADPVAAEVLKAAIQRGADPSIADPWPDLRIYSECLERDREFSRVEIWGNGIGIWNGERQFILERQQILAILELLEERQLLRMKSIYGGRDDPKPGEPGQGGAGPGREVVERQEGAALRVVCRMLLEVDGHAHQSNQLDRGRLSEELVALSREVLSRVREVALRGTSAETLGAGLAKMADGTLAPEALSLLLNKRPEASAEDGGARNGRAGDGFLLRIQGRRITSSLYHRETGYGGERELILSPEAIGEIAALLAASDLSSMPKNLYATHYTDLTVAVLSHEARVQARRFSGMTPNQHGEPQGRFNNLVVVLTELGKRVRADGEPVPEED